MRIIQSIWEGKTDISGSLFDLSTSYNLTFVNKIAYEEDLESSSRFYHKKDIKNDARPHIVTYRVWFDSMNLRYYIEMFVFLFVIIKFQYSCNLFNTDLHLMKCDQKNM